MTSSAFSRHRPSRRTFLEAAVTLASAAPFAAAHADKADASNGTLLAYCGTYSSPQGPEGSKGNGQGIYLLQLDRESGALSQRELFATDTNPSWLALNASRTHLYSANETNTFEGKKTGSASAYSVDRSTGKLKFLNTVSSEGAGPTHCSVHPSGKYLLARCTRRNHGWDSNPKCCNGSYPRKATIEGVPSARNRPVKVSSPVLRLRVNVVMASPR